jgi:RNA polymerase sigma factor (sigma-70 family)
MNGFMTDQQLLVRIAEKDSKAFEVLYNRYERLFYRWAFSRLNDYDVACDVTQSFWISVWTSPEIIQPNEHGSAKDYLLRSLSFKILKVVQQELKHIKVTDEHYIEQHLPDLSYTHISEELYVKEILQLMDAILQKLPPLTRQIYELRYVKNRSVQETAETLSISDKTVRNGLSSALSVIRRDLKVLYDTGQTDKLSILLPFLISQIEKNLHH